MISVNYTLNLFISAGLYVKVTLFESLKVVKAKKTRPITITNLEGEFKECFSILFPIAFIDQVLTSYILHNSIITMYRIFAIKTRAIIRPVSLILPEFSAIKNEKNAPL